MSATTPDTGHRAGSADGVRPAVGGSGGSPPRADTGRLGLALAVIATAQLMVVLDATIVNVALPHIQNALHFSGSNLEWVVNAYALAFGGLLLLGGRSGDLLGRRRIFIAGILLFSLASLLGGFATSQEWLLGARVLQGIGGALAAPTALSLIAVTFPEGPPRNRAMGVYAAMSVAGGAVGLIAGGLLTQYANWRWVFFVNVPIGLVLAFLAPRVLGESERRRGAFDLPGAVTGSLGLAALVYGLSSAATSPNGVSHWGDTKVIVSLVAAVVLLVAFGFIETRSKHALVPIRVLRSRDRTGSYLIMLCVGTALFGMFFFLTLFVQNVWGYSALKTGLAYLPMIGTVMLASGIASQLINRIGARPLMIAGTAIATGGMFWLSRITEHSHYASGLLGPMMVTALGMGLTFVPMSLVALTKVADNDAGVASSLLNTGQQVGGSIGLAILGTVAWSAVSNSIHSQAAAAAQHATAHISGAKAAALQKAMSDHALATGFSKGYLVSAGIAALALIITLVAIRVKKSDLQGINPMAAPGA
ncbi:MAG TPA: MFS transporter [Streptosporangiaceae bacterium]|nr:MFS transporter [Streptosporangiaceae bacterium]